MAKATLKTTTITKVEGVTLELNKEEMETLAAILQRVGGDPHKSRRGHADNIGSALYAAGHVNTHTSDIDATNRAIYFKDVTDAGL